MRTYRIYRRDIVPLGKVKSNFNFNLDDKRVLNFDNVVSDDDNVKQDISIDVYGRKVGICLLFPHSSPFIQLVVLHWTYVAPTRRCRYA